MKYITEYIGVLLIVIMVVALVFTVPGEPIEYSELSVVEMKITYTDSSVDTIVATHNAKWPVKLELGDLKVTRHSVNENTVRVPMYTIKSGVRDFVILNVYN